MVDADHRHHRVPDGQSAPRPPVTRSSTAAGDMFTRSEPTAAALELAQTHPRPVSRRRALARATRPSQRALAFGVRSNVVAVAVDDAEAGPVAEGPLEVVEQAPVRVAAHVDAVVEAVEHALERGRARTSIRCASSSVPMPFSVTRIGTSPFVYSHARRIVRLQRLGVVLVAHDQRGHAVLGPEHARSGPTRVRE